MEGKKTQGIKIFKVKDLEDSSKYPELPDILPQPPFLLIGYGSVRSGKTNSLINMMRREDMYGPKYWDNTCVISNTALNDPKMYTYMGDVFRVEDHFENRMIDDLIKHQKSFKREFAPTQLIILDDIISRDFKKTASNSINSLASKFRHFEMSIMIFTQSARAISPIIRSNGTDILIYRQQSSLEWEKIKEEYKDLAPKNFVNYYNITQKRDFGFLYIKCSKNPCWFIDQFEEVIGIGDKMLWKGSLESGENTFE